MKKGIKKFLGWAILTLILIALILIGFNVGMFYLYGGAEDEGRALLYVLGFYVAFLCVIDFVYLIAWAISLIQN